MAAHVFEITADETSGYTGEISGTSRWGLPGLTCDVCKATWAHTGLFYPAIDLTALPNASRYENTWPVPLDELARLRELILHLIPEGAPSPGPGTHFGPTIGTAKGSFGHFELSYWTLFVRAETFAALKAEGVRGLIGVKPQLEFREKLHPELLELQIEPGPALHPSCIRYQKPPCPACGRAVYTVERPVIDASTVPPDRDLFRVRDWYTCILGSARFAEAVRHLRLEGITLQPMPTA
jgi:uncharacterized double-CXXCG motif protein